MSLSSPILFISDLHLEESRPEITATLLHFLQQHTGKCAALYILGDLFEAWIGDDEESALAITVADALQDFQRAGSDIYLMHGNRDFLIGESFATRCGARLLPETHVLNTAAGSYLLLHGDTLCTDDHDYLKFRQMVRNSEWQAEFLAQSLDARRAFAEQARQQSQAATAEKSATIMDVNQDAVLELLQQQGVAQLIHGHTHRPDTHHIELTNESGERTDAVRLVLGDWDRKGWYASLQEGVLDLHNFPLLSA